MAKHTCLRCGFETSCLHSWPDRRPIAAALFAVPVTLFGLGAIAAYPWIFVPLLVLAGVGYVVDREYRRRQALAVRADWEHQAVIAASVPPVRPLPQRQAPSLPWQIVKLLRTEPLRMGRL